MCSGMIDRMEQGSQRILMLIADDDLREIASYWSEALGWTVDVASHGGHATKMLRNVGYRALVTDRFIPPWPGLDSIPKLKRRYPRVRIVVLLNRGPIGTAAVLRLAGADAVIEPPVRQAALMDAVLPHRDARKTT
jgi:DNA-binding response OmpR family regulator